MIKTFVACTAEIDDEQLAIEQIKSQLDLDGLLKNSFGIISCHYEFALSGGEIGPVPNCNNSDYFSMFHNYSIIACLI